MRRHLTKGQTIERLRAIYAEHGRVSYELLQQRAPTLLVAVRRHFGGVVKARAAAEIPKPPPHRRWTIERVLDELRAVWNDGIVPTTSGLVAAGRRDLIAAIGEYIGGIARARRLASIPDPPRAHVEIETWDESRVLAEIRIRRHVGEPLASTKVPYKLLSAAMRYFGTWRAAVETAGIRYDTVRILHRAYSKADVLKALRQMRRSRPAARLVDVYNAKFIGAIRKHFGSVANALDAAGIVGWPATRRQTGAKRTIEVGGR
jgi:hypothetical protein